MIKRCSKYWSTFQISNYATEEWQVQEEVVLVQRVVRRNSKQQQENPEIIIVPTRCLAWETSMVVIVTESAVHPIENQDQQEVEACSLHGVLLL